MNDCRRECMMNQGVALMTECNSYAGLTLKLSCTELRPSLDSLTTIMSPTDLCPYTAQ